MNLALYYAIVLFIALIVMVLAFFYVVLKSTKKNRLSKEIIFHFEQDNQSKSLSDMIDFHKNKKN